jgi:hypothetical protein
VESVSILCVQVSTSGQFHKNVLYCLRCDLKCERQKRQVEVERAQPCELMDPF